MTERITAIRQSGQENGQDNGLAMQTVVLVATALIASSFPAAALIADSLPIAVLTFSRYALAALILGALLKLSGKRLWHGFGLMGRCALLSLCLVSYMWLLFLALRHTSPLNTSALYTLVPGLSSLFAFAINRERLSRRQNSALLVGMVGCLWIIYRGEPWRFFTQLPNLGDVIFLGSCLLIALYVPLVKRLYTGVPIAVNTFWTLTTGALWLLPSFLWELPGLDLGAVDSTVIIGVLYLTVAATIMSFFLYQYCSVRLGAARTASYGYLSPAMVMVMQWALVGEAVDPMILPGLAVVVACMFIVQRGRLAAAGRPATLAAE